ncbi:MAG: ATP-binding protein [Chloroflexota bacterium]
MSVFTALTLFLKNLTAAVSLGLAFIVLLQSQRRLVNWLFSLLMLTLTLWSGGSFLLHFSTVGLEGEALWQAMALLGLVTMPQALYLLALALSQVPSGVFCTASVAFGFVGMASSWVGIFSGGYVASMEVAPSLVLIYAPKVESLFFWGTLAYGFVQVSLSIAVIFWSVWRTYRQSGRVSREKLLLGLGGGTAVLGGSLNAFPALGVLPLDSLLMIGSGLIFAYLILQEQFFDPLHEAHDQLSAANVQLREQAQQLREVNQRLREADRLKNEFVANMSHELRTPLNSIIGFARVILNGIDGPLTDEQRTDLTAIYTSGQHLLNLVNDILDLSRIAAGRMTLKREKLHFKELTLGVMPSILPLVEGKPIELREEIAEDLPMVFVDRVRIRQVVLNLLSNAAKFTDRGAITLRAELHMVSDDGSSPPVPYVLCSVRDTGIGIAEKDFEIIFEEFRQLDSSTARRAEGSGLGLSISRRLVELHGGAMWLESQLGRGSTFFFTLPVSPTHRSQEPVFA